MFCGKREGNENFANAMTNQNTNCMLGSAKKMVKRGGEWVAVCHEVAKTGYKAKNAYGAKSIFYGETTNSYFQNGVKHVGSGSGSQKKLMPYYPNASRNRPKETMENITGSRFGTQLNSIEPYRGSSVVTLRDGDPESSRTWKTTNQIFSECALVSDTIGLSNQGISSQVARDMHKKQGLYQARQTGN